MTREGEKDLAPGEATRATRVSILPHKPRRGEKATKPSFKKPFETARPVELVGKTGTFGYNGQNVEATVQESTRIRSDSNLDLLLTFSDGKTRELKGVKIRKFRVGE